MTRRLSLFAFALPLLAALPLAGAKADFLVGVVAYEQKDYATALQEFSDSALAAVPEAQGYLGRMYLFGLGVERDPDRGLVLMESAARGGDLESISMMAQAYDMGMGVAQDKAKALEFWRLGAAQGSTKAQVELGRGYQIGTATADGRPDYEEAARWLGEAAAKGDAQAMTELGLMAQGGLGMAQDDALAMDYYRRAAGKGQPLAMDRLARLLVARYQAGESADLAQARDLAETAVKREGQPAFHDTLGSILLLQGDQAGAEAEFKLAAKKSPLYSAAREHLGDLYWQQGRRAEAKASWEAALDLARNDGDRQRLEEKLERVY